MEVIRISIIPTKRSTQLWLQTLKVDRQVKLIVITFITFDIFAQLSKVTILFIDIT